ncbi:uncharacterized protein ARMOST_22321 [Armillaria ostoyae]|uniref:Uncharacterized protein n=1 Tax=Armillaria ostoyae TaxID=47428 RepID=A0A284SCI8_ARMOS|nr:uncharacterized protein ARMOST_22321 [Armillaria ostoyae]
MANQTDTLSLSDLTDADKASIRQILGSTLDSTILYSLFHGIYTGIVAVTLGNIFMTKSLPVGKSMIAIIILLHIITTINFGLDISFIHSIFVDNAQSIVTKYLFSIYPGLSTSVGLSITSAICSVLADATIIWHCWIVWGQCWLSILLPILLLISAIVFKIFAEYEAFVLVNDNLGNVYFMIYLSSVLATTILCTILIIYQIVTVV